MSDDEVRCVEFGSLERVWDSGYYDGVLSGAAKLDGERVWFNMMNDAHRDGGFVYGRVFGVYKLTDEEWAREEESYNLFSRLVSSTRDYRIPKEERTVKPQPWDDYYKTQKKRPALVLNRDNLIAVASRLPYYDVDEDYEP
jgi:hypothetical protein